MMGEGRLRSEQTVLHRWGGLGLSLTGRDSGLPMCRGERARGTGAAADTEGMDIRGSRAGRAGPLPSDREGSHSVVTVHAGTAPFHR